MTDTSLNATNAKMDGSPKKMHTPKMHLFAQDVAEPFPVISKEKDMISEVDIRDMQPDPTNVVSILEERGKRYGSFVGHSAITQGLKAVMAATPNWNKLAVDQREALDMVAHKIGRVLNGDPDYLDSWVDIVGYTQLVIDRLNGKIR